MVIKLLKKQQQKITKKKKTHTHTHTHAQNKNKNKPTNYPKQKHFSGPFACLKLSSLDDCNWHIVRKYCIFIFRSLWLQWLPNRENKGGRSTSSKPQPHTPITCNHRFVQKNFPDEAGPLLLVFQSVLNFFPQIDSAKWPLSKQGSKYFFSYRGYLFEKKKMSVILRGLFRGFTGAFL